MPKVSTLVLWTAAVAFAAVAILYWHNARFQMAWAERRWKVQRFRELGVVGERIRAFAEANGGDLPVDLQELNRLGVIASSEFEFDDANAMSMVRRNLRPVPSIELPGDLLLIVETCDRYPEYRLCLYLDGTTVFCEDGDRVAEDNKRRRELGLQPIREFSWGNGRAHQSEP